MGTIKLREQTIEILSKADVVVCGGGPAGFAAAVAAARNGADTVLLEKAIFAGGMTTGGLLPSIIHMSDGERNVVSGICKEVVDEVAHRMGIRPNYHWQNIHSEILKNIYDEMLEAAGVKIFYGIQVCQVVAHQGKITSVVVATSQGLKAVNGELFIDATGDGNIAVWAGAPYEVGDELNNTMAPTLCVSFSNFEKISQWNAVGREEWRKASDLGTAPVEEGHFVGFFRHSAKSGSGNIGHIYEVNPLEENDFSRCAIEGRELAKKYHDFFKQHVLGFENSELTATASQLGIRETRRITGEYILSFDDYINRRHFSDDIGCLAYPIDIHASATDVRKQQEVERKLSDSRYAPGENYGIPFRALLPRKTNNLLVAGRCISTDRAMQSSIRIVPGCFATGQAAGTAAAMAVENNTELRKIDISALQSSLRRQGVFINAKQQ